MTSRTIYLLVLLLAGTGCDTDGPVPGSWTESEVVASGAKLAAQFDPNSAGRIEGRVVWEGAFPEASPFVFGVAKGPGDFATELIPNPNLPQIDQESRAIAGAVLFLRGVDPTRAKPWDHPPVAVRAEGRAIRIVQGSDSSRQVGFVRRGSEVTMMSGEPEFQVLRARGAAFFSYTFPEPNRPINRRLEKAGIVELSHGAGYYWARAYLFVCDHPYYAVTDQLGRFGLEQVPPGEYEWTAWLPNCRTKEIERDPESGLAARLRYEAPIIVTGRVTVHPGASEPVNLSVRDPR